MPNKSLRYGHLINASKGSLFQEISSPGFRIQPHMTKFRRAILVTALLFATTLLRATAQNRHNDNAYYNGMRDGVRGGSYYSNHDRPYHDDHRGTGCMGPAKELLSVALAAPSWALCSAAGSRARSLAEQLVLA